MTKATNYTKPIIKKCGNSQIEIISSIPSVLFESFRKQALQTYNDEISIDGFRKGKIPENILISKVGEMAILEEMAQLAISHIYPQLIIEEKLDAIGRPEIQITKIASGIDLEFKIITAVIPEVKLGDYKKISQATPVPTTEDVTTKEVDDAILNIQKSRVDHSGHKHDNLSHDEHEKMIMNSLPPLTDEFAKSLGDFKDIADLKTKVRIMLSEDKIEKAKEKRRIAISDKLIESTTIILPDILIESELRRIEGQFKDDISRMGVTLEDYMKHAKKTLEELRTEWRPHAEKKAKLQLILNTIAKVEKINIDKKDIDAEVQHILNHYKDADRERAEIYAETVLLNEKVFKFLETHATNTTPPKDK